MSIQSTFNVKHRKSAKLPCCLDIKLSYWSLSFVFSSFCHQGNFAFVSFCLFLILSFCLFAFLPFCLFIILPCYHIVFLSFCLSVFLSCHFFLLSFCLFVFLSFCLEIILINQNTQFLLLLLLLCNKKSESIFLLYFSKHDQLDLLKVSYSISQNMINWIC